MVNKTRRKYEVSFHFVFTCMASGAPLGPRPTFSAINVRTRVTISFASLECFSAIPGTHKVRQQMHCAKHEAVPTRRSCDSERESISKSIIVRVTGFAVPSCGLAILLQPETKASHSRSVTRMQRSQMSPANGAECSPLLNAADLLRLLSCAASRFPSGSTAK
jgi:hypothetical protein